MCLQLLRWSRFAPRVFLTLAVAGLWATLPAPAAEVVLQRGVGPLRLDLQGPPGTVFQVENSPALGGSNWTQVLTVTLNGQSHGWYDAESAFLPRGFYRVLRLDGPLPFSASEDFRLVDYQGWARELNYEVATPAVVLIFVGNQCARLADLAAPIRALRDQYTPLGVKFWLINSDPLATRSNLAAQATALNLNLPVLQDEGQLVARQYQIHTATEVVAVAPALATVFYRGAIDDRVGTNAAATTQNYLADALAQFLAGQPIAVSRTKPQGCDLTPPPLPAVSYGTNIAPILIARCVPCHSPGNLASAHEGNNYSFTNYTSVTNLARIMPNKLLRGEMPPWHADPQIGVFTNTLALPTADRAVLLQWLAQGAPRGAGPDPLVTLSAPTNYPSSWPKELGTPDYIYAIPNQSIPATGTVSYRYLTINTAIPSNAWLRAAVVKPGNLKAVHHSLVFIGSVLDVFINNNGGLGGFFAGYVPGAGALAYPTNTGKYLAQNSQMTFQMHYTTTGQPETDQTQIGLYLLRSPPSLEFKTRGVSTTTFSIPPGATDYEVTASWTTPTARDIWLYEMNPHMHYRGSRFRYEAVYPGGATEVLLSVPKYHFDWQTPYRLAQPKWVPRGTVIRCVGAFDNSDYNPYNPDSSATVAFGEQTYEEMFIGYLNYAEIP